MNKAAMDKLRSSTLHGNEILQVEYFGEYNNFPKGQLINAIPRHITRSGLPYPSPKWVACCYTVVDLDGNCFEVAQKRYGKLYKGFKWIKNKEE